MAFDWLKYLEVAREWAKREEEVYMRSAISRAYYCVFNKVRFCAGQNVKFQQDLHKELIAKLKNPDEKLAFKMNLDEADIRQIGNDLEVFRIERNDADYDGLCKNITKKSTEKSIERADFILNILYNS